MSTPHGNAAGENARRHAVVEEVVRSGGTILDAVQALGCMESAARVWLRDNGYGTALRSAGLLSPAASRFRTISSSEVAAAGLGYEVLCRLWGGVHRQTAFSWVKRYASQLHEPLLCRRVDPVANFTARSGCYLFSWNGEVVYVGQAVNLKRRLREHYSGVSSSTDIGILLRYCPGDVSVTIVETDRGELDATEAALISQHNPRFNGGRRGRQITPDELAAIAALSSTRQ